MEKLRESIENAFAFISDSNQVIIKTLAPEVQVEVKSILPSNIIYTDLSSYISMNSLWNETLLDISAVIEQLTGNGLVGHTVEVNTVGNVKIKFRIENSRIFQVVGSKVVVSSINLGKAIGESFGRIEYFPSTNNFIFYFSEIMPPSYCSEVSKKIVRVFKDNGVEIKMCNTFYNGVGNLRGEAEYEVIRKGVNKLLKFKLQNYI